MLAAAAGSLGDLESAAGSDPGACISVLGETWAYRSFLSGLLAMGLLRENRYKDRGEVTQLVLWAFPTCQQAAPTSAGVVWSRLNCRSTLHI
ncbi:hypothetical protein MG293_011755 [Ovis ammon polii]|uniref:Uncharacterized protein n=1 Tax=Ovis ammon polii TaxID=230172 RepID=A0AAD4U1Z0_OVIAM|nr:hypothetical protein MG293_011755 [Ovis ammon polii]KAI4562542.1 hypothetical protein MJT46_011504 [Ovis ammon polii x Ovis aries]